MDQSTLNPRMMKINFQSFAEALMEHSFRIGWIIITISLLSLALGLSSCGEDNDKASDPHDLLKRTWILGSEGSITKDGSDVTDEYTGLQVTFSSDGTYAALNSGHFFDASGTWAWQGNTTTGLTLDGDFSVQVAALSETDLHLQLVLEAGDLEEGRLKGLVGEYDLRLKAQ
jgi:hypothetical protein